MTSEEYFYIGLIVLFAVLLTIVLIIRPPYFRSIKKRERTLLEFANKRGLHLEISTNNRLLTYGDKETTRTVTGQIGSHNVSIRDIVQCTLNVVSVHLADTWPYSNRYTEIWIDNKMMENSEKKKDDYMSIEKINIALDKAIV